MGLFAHDIFDYFQNFKQQYSKSQLACDFKVSAIRYGNILEKGYPWLLYHHLILKNGIIPSIGNQKTSPTMVASQFYN